MQFNLYTAICFGIGGLVLLVIVFLLGKRITGLSFGKDKNIFFNKSLTENIEKIVDVSIQILNIIQFETFEEQKVNAKYKGNLIIERLSSAFKELLRAKILNTCGNTAFSFEYKNYSNLLKRLYYEMIDIFEIIFKKNGFAHLEDHEYKERKKLIVDDVSKIATETFDNFYCSTEIPRDEIEDYNRKYIVDYVEVIVGEIIDDAKQIYLANSKRIELLKEEKRKIIEGNNG